VSRRTTRREPGLPAAAAPSERPPTTPRTPCTTPSACLCRWTPRPWTWWTPWGSWPGARGRSWSGTGRRPVGVGPSVLFLADRDTVAGQAGDLSQHGPGVPRVLVSLL